MGTVVTFRGQRNPGSLREVNGPADPRADEMLREVVIMPNAHARSKRDRDLRMQAIAVVSILPDDPSEMQRVMDYAQELVTEFVMREKSGLRVVKRD